MTCGLVDGKNEVSTFCEYLNWKLPLEGVLQKLVSSISTMSDNDGRVLTSGNVVARIGDVTRVLITKSVDPMSWYGSKRFNLVVSSIGSVKHLSKARRCKDSRIDLGIVCREYAILAQVDDLRY